MRIIKTFEDFVFESTEQPVKYVLWDLYSRDNKKVESCSFTFINKIEYHAQIANAMEQHHPKLFKLENNRYVRTKLGLDLGVLPPSDSYSLTCGLENKIADFLNFWKSEGYTLVYDEPTMNEELFKEYIKNKNLTKFTKNTLK